MSAEGQRPIPKSEQPLKRGARPGHGLVGQASCLSLRDRQDACPANTMGSNHPSLSPVEEYAIRIANWTS